MSADMTGIYQQSLFSKSIAISVAVPESNKHRVLASVLPWELMANTANRFRSETINITNGRPLDLRMHLGVFVAQSMNNWTDRETEEMLRYHAGVRILCGLEESTNSLDRTSIEKFRNSVGKKGTEELNYIIVQHAIGAGFTGSEICSSDTTVQEAPIQHPTEVGHMKKISEKLVGIGKKIGGKISQAMATLGNAVQAAFTESRLFTRGKKEKAIKRKKELSRQMHAAIEKMLDLASKNLPKLSKKPREKSLEQVALYKRMQNQIIQWLKKGEHPVNKIISLWDLEARAITRNKAAKIVEFGRRWIVTRLMRGYIIGDACQKLGGDSDVKILDEVLINFLNATGEVPENIIYDRGGDGEKNHKIISDVGVSNNCIFLKGKNTKMDVSPEVFEMARTERALSEASIATVKHNKYGFNKPRARSADSCALKAQAAFLGFNINHLVVDVQSTWNMALEIT